MKTSRVFLSSGFATTQCGAVGCRRARGKVMEDAGRHDSITQVNNLDRFSIRLSKVLRMFSHFTTAAFNNLDRFSILIPLKPH
jgi:hypothetical protein